MVYEPSPLVEEIGPAPPASPRRTVIGGRVGDVANLVKRDGTLRLHDLIYGKVPSLFVLPGDRAPAAIAEARSLLQEVVHEALLDIIAIYSFLRRALAGACGGACGGAEWWCRVLVLRKRYRGQQL